MKQLTPKQTETIIAQAVVRAFGFGPTTGTVTVNVDEIRRVASRAAYVALELAGNLNEANAAEDEYIRQQAEKAPNIA